MKRKDQRDLYRLVNKSCDDMGRQEALFSRRKTLYWQLVDLWIPRRVARWASENAPLRWLPSRGLDLLPEAERERMIRFYTDLANAQNAMNRREFEALAEDMEPLVEAVARVAQVFAEGRRV